MTVEVSASDPKIPAGIKHSSYIARRHRLRHDLAGRGHSLALLGEKLQERKEGPTQRTLAMGCRQHHAHALKGRHRPTEIAQYGGRDMLPTRASRLPNGDASSPPPFARGERPHLVSAAF